jgi:hypothetical protein
MAHPQFSDGEDGLQLWRVAANKFNKQSQTADKLSATSLLQKFTLSLKFGRISK